MKHAMFFSEFNGGTFLNFCHVSFQVAQRNRALKAFHNRFRVGRVGRGSIGMSIYGTFGRTSDRASPLMASDRGTALAVQRGGRGENAFLLWPDLRHRS